MDPVAEYRVALTALRPYLDDIVVVGGMAMNLYHFKAGHAGGPPPVRTKDLDFAAPRRLPLRGGSPVNRLLLDSGMTSDEFPVLGRPGPKVKYRLPVTEGEIEFLTDLRGREAEDSVPVQPGLIAEKVRYLSILVEGSWPVDVGGGLILRIPHPGRFVFQQILCSPKRRTENKAAKGLYYVYNVLANFREWHRDVLSEVAVLKRDCGTWYQRFVSFLKSHFLLPDADGPALVESQRMGKVPEKAVFEVMVRQRIEEFVAELE